MNKITLQFINKKTGDDYEKVFYSVRRKIFIISLLIVGVFGI